MKWTVLSDNRTNNDLLETEHGLSILLETDKHRILLDTGASDVFIRNAERLGIDLSAVDYVFISHGHSDHAGGLKRLMEINDKVQVIVSPDAVSGKFFSKRRYLHSITTEWPEGNQERFLMIEQAQDIADDLHIIAHISQKHPMPQGNQHLFVENADGDYINDDFRHELALYVDGLLFTGCAHSGLENILAACPYPVKTVVGGFHLLDDHETTEELSALAQRLKTKYPETLFYTSHCTGDKVFAILKAVMGDQLHAFSCGMMSKGLIIFDFDGTLGDTRRNIVTTMQMTIAELHLPKRSEAACAATIGLPLAGCFRALFPDIQDEMIPRCAETYRRIFNENLQNIHPEAFPGVVETLSILHRKGFTLTIASSRSHNSLTELTLNMGIADYISYLLGADDVKEAKPKPEPVLKTLAATHFDAGETLVVGDMAVDIQMGAHAGAKTCGVTWGNGTKAELEAAGATFIIDRIEDLIEIVDHSDY